MIVTLLLAMCGLGAHAQSPQTGVYRIQNVGSKLYVKVTGKYAAEPNESAQAEASKITVGVAGVLDDGTYKMNSLASTYTTADGQTQSVEVYDYVTAALRRNRLNPADRNLNTDVTVDPNEEVMISKDTAYVDDDGNIVRQTINRPLSGPWDFLNTYIVNIYPDTTCWVNDFQNSDNEVYLRNYFSNPAYNDYPVVGVTWEQANAFCAWRTDYLLKGLGPEARYVQRYRLPTEAEWEYAARGKDQNEFPWENQDVVNGNGCFYANFKPDRGNYTKDGNLITAKVGSYSANSNGLYDMAGNVAEWTSTVYTEAGVDAMNDLNPQLRYNAAKEDPYKLKKKSVRGGSWKDPESFIRSAWRSWEYENQPRSYIGFRCVRSLANSVTGKQKR